MARETTSGSGSGRLLLSTSILLRSLNSCHDNGPKFIAFEPETLDPLGLGLPISCTSSRPRTFIDVYLGPYSTYHTRLIRPSVICAVIQAEKRLPL